MMAEVTPILRLAHQQLSNIETELVNHLSMILNDNQYDSEKYIGTIIPKYWESMDGISRTLDPQGIYRPLYYVHSYGSVRDFHLNTRTFMTNVSGHIEGCVGQLLRSAPVGKSLRGPLGALIVKTLHDGLISDEQANPLMSFNKAVFVPAKHFNTYIPTNRIDERTFSVREASCAFVLMRKFSIWLFDLITLTRPI